MKLNTSVPNKCALCGGVKLKYCESHVDGSKPYDLYECFNCKIQFWWPMKNPGANWYSKDERYSFRNSDPLMRPVNSHLEFLKDGVLGGGDLLDVGCGTGNFLSAAQKIGYNVRGIDFDGDAIDVAKNSFGLTNVSVEMLEDVAKSGAKFDAATFFEVVEHLDDVNGYLQLVRGILKSEGYIGLSVPYRGSWNVFKLYDKPPRHLTRWDEVSVTNTLERNGFEVVRIKLFITSLDYLITKFHFWTSGFLSFGLVQKMELGGSKDKNNAGPIGAVVKSNKIIVLKKLAKTKDYILFFIPAVVLFCYLYLTGKAFNGMFVLAKKK